MANWSGVDWAVLVCLKGLIGLLGLYCLVSWIEVAGALVRLGRRGVAHVAGREAR